MRLEGWDLSPREGECKMSGDLPGEGSRSMERGILLRSEGMAL